MRSDFITILVFVFLQSCSNSGEQKNNSIDILKSENIQSEEVIPVESGDTEIEDSILVPSQPSLDKDGKTNIRFITFKNSDNNGFGYDIEVDGRVYIHQPYIPAIPGNNGFKSKDDAEKVARLMEYKIKNNILPPTIEIKELDSLGVKN